MSCKLVQIFFFFFFVACNEVFAAENDNLNVMLGAKSFQNDIHSYF